MDINAVPTTPDEVRAKFKAEYEPLLAGILTGIFECNLAEGRPCLDAYKETLLAHIQVCDESRRTTSRRTERRTK